MNGNEWKAAIETFITDYVKEYPDKNHLPHLWRTPLVGYADAFDPYIQRLPEIVAKVHRLPQDIMEDPKVVICYFIPFTRELERTNVGVANNAASENWAQAYKITNAMMARLNEDLANEIIRLGGRAVVPEGAGMLKELLKSS